ncbi:ribonuclease E inhibitor RraB [Paenisporosarcina sp. TG-14]|uniref:ribonuclease E inhibitor RraB n=1 Tax=Paenisporosarcina sp. TG-14 TaxID=1231057 RepID=UPI00178C3016|nr:ribonuclease E inhibitor RraB [Paenisporosarcina sp. TG-14]
MGNHSVLESLVESGDKLKIPRKVEHIVLFQNEKMMKFFTIAVKKDGFTIEEESSEKDEGDYVICISRIDSVDYLAIDEFTDLLNCREV